MKHRSLIVAFTLAVTLSLIISACAPSPTPAPAVQQPTSPPAAQPTSKPAEPQAPAAQAQYEPMKMEAPDCEYGGTMKAIEALDEKTVKFTLCAPDPAFLAKVAVPSFPILDKDFLDSIGGDATKLNDNPVGTGPYVVKEWVRGDHITFEVNPDYWGEPAKNQTFILKWAKEAAGRLLDLQSGNVNGIDNVGTDDVESVENDPSLELYPRITNNFLYLGVNNNIPPFDNEKVRQAFHMAIDKQRIVDNFYAPGSLAADQFIPPGVKPGYTENFQGTKYDPEKAKQLLEEAGFDFSKEYVLAYAERTRPYFPQPTKIAQDVQAQLAEIGVKIKLSLQEWAAYLPRIRAGEEALYFLGWSEDYPDATNWYDVFLMGSSAGFGTPFPDIMEQIRLAANTADPVVRQKAYDTVNKLYDEHVPCIVISHGTTSLAFDKNVENVVIGPYNENFSQMQTDSGQLVFSTDGEPVSLYCADETDGNSFRACLQIFDTLYNFKWGTSTLQPSLAEKCEANPEGTEWTCTLRQGVKYSNGAVLDANDVVASYVNMWDYNSPNRTGNTGVYQYWKDFFGPKALNEPPE